MSTFPELFNNLLTGAFVATDPFLISADRVPLDFEFSGAGTVEWFLEFASDDPHAASTVWHREVDEEDIGSGVVHMFPVVRDFVLTAGNLNRSAQLIRTHKFVRVQIRQTVGAFVTARVLAVFGFPAQSAT